VTIPFEEKSQKEISDCVGARHFWLVKPLRGFYLYSKPKEIIPNSLIKGEAEKYKDILIPLEIQFLDILTLESPLILKLQCKDGKPLYLKYGSEKITTAKIDGKYPVCDNIRKLYSFEINNTKYNFIKEKTISYLHRMDHEIQMSGNKWGLNFRYPFLCRIGYCISIDPFDEYCPVKDKCNILGCEGKKHWTGAIGKRRIYPKFNVNLNVRNLPQIREPITYDINTITYEELAEDVEFVYDTVTVYLPTGINDYRLREFDISPLGYLARTSIVYLSFNETFINLILLALLVEQDVVELLKFKFYMCKKLEEKLSAIDAALDYVRYDSTKIDINTDEFRSFVKECLIHTIAHLFLIFLITEKVQIDPEKITYFIKSNTVYVIENSKNNGMGFVETIRNEIKNCGREFIKEFIEWAIDFLKKHDRRLEDRLRELTGDSKNCLAKLKQGGMSNKLEILLHKIREINKKINSFVKLDIVDVITYRHILSQELTAWDEYSDELSEYILTLLHLEGVPRLCADGCEECLIFYRGCRKPFLQSYIISKALALKFLETIKRGHLSLVGKGIGQLLKDFMEKSEKVVIHTPFVDEYGLSVLRDCVERNIDIELITKPDNPYIAELQKYGIKVMVRPTHAKMYLLRSARQEICIQGSVNLTRSSFVEKEENLVLLWDDKILHGVSGIEDN